MPPPLPKAPLFYKKECFPYEKRVFLLLFWMVGLFYICIKNVKSKIPCTLLRPWFATSGVQEFIKSEQGNNVKRTIPANPCSEQVVDHAAPFATPTGNGKIVYL